MNEWMSEWLIDWMSNGQRTAVMMSHNYSIVMVPNKKSLHQASDSTCRLEPGNCIVRNHDDHGSGTSPHRMKMKQIYCPPGPLSLGQLPTKTTTDQHTHSSGPIPVWCGIALVGSCRDTNNHSYMYSARLILFELVSVIWTCCNVTLRSSITAQFHWILFL